MSGRKQLKAMGLFVYNTKKYMDQKIQRTLAALEKNGFQTFFAPTKHDALEQILRLIPSSASVGIPGSISIREIDLINSLIARGNIVYEHWRDGISEQEKVNLMRKEMNSDFYVSSSNAITEDGNIINIDGTGNRVAAMVFGPQKVIVVAGINKIVKDVAEGIQRIKNITAPMRARTSGKKTPCAQTGICTDCDAPERVCCVTTIIERKPLRTDFTVILVGEELGL